MFRSTQSKAWSFLLSFYIKPWNKNSSNNPNRPQNSQNSQNLKVRLLPLNIGIFTRSVQPEWRNKHNAQETSGVKSGCLNMVLVGCARMRSARGRGKPSQRGASKWRKFTSLEIPDFWQRRGTDTCLAGASLMFLKIQFIPICFHFFFKAAEPKIKRCPSRLGISAQPAREGLTEKAACLLRLVARGRLRALGTGSETRTWRLYRAHMLPAPTWSLCRQERHVGRRARLWSDPPNDTSGKEQLVPRFPHLSSSGKWYSRAYRGPSLLGERWCCVHRAAHSWADLLPGRGSSAGFTQVILATG